MDAIPPPLWIAACAHHLQVRWPTVSPHVLEDTARELLRDSHLRELLPEVAAATWLQPLAREA
ncbi:MAG: hypothetical protein REJ50_19020 [Bordetella sp.]|nr:hypothetical protein [Bordetella sp.]